MMANNVPAVLYQNRFCDQKNFDLIVPEVFNENERLNRRINKIKSRCFTTIETVDFTLKNSMSDLTLTSGTDIYKICIHDLEKKDIDNVRGSFAESSLNVNLLNLPDKRVRFCACVFMKDLYVFGGYCDLDYSKTCFKYVTRSKKWIKISDMKIKKEDAACTPFEGKIIVSGGKVHRGCKKVLHGLAYVDDGVSKSVEAYDYHENNWTSLPDMINSKSSHEAVSVGNKMFVIDGTCEVYDSISRTFTEVRQLNNSIWYETFHMRAFSTGLKLIIFTGAFGLKCKSSEKYDKLLKKSCLEENVGEVELIEICLKVPTF